MRTEAHSGPVERKKDRRGEGERGAEEEMSSVDPDGQANLPPGISVFRNPIFPV